MKGVKMPTINLTLSLPDDIFAKANEVGLLNPETVSGLVIGAVENGERP